MAAAPPAMELGQQVSQDDVDAVITGTRLCADCQSIDLAKCADIPADQIPVDGLYLSLVGRLRNGPNKGACPMCDLCATVRDKYSTARNHQLRAYNHADLVPPQASRLADGPIMPPGLVLSVLRGDKKLSFHARVRHSEIIAGGLLVLYFNAADREGRDSLAPAGVRKIGECIDWKLLRSWIDVCQASHQSLCQRQAFRVSSMILKVIDCESRCVVTLPEGGEYLALSYVWGKIQQTWDTSIDQTWPHLPAELPKTISDAILVTVHLGHRYLWVDRYCTSRHNRSVLQSQIAKMDQVFEGAVATIVDLHGKDANAGLPGVSTMPRSPQPCLNFKGVELVSTLLPLGDALDQSTWCTRGWTYQEGRLAQRLLFFSSSQVYFSCLGMTQSEAVSDGPGQPVSAINVSKLGPGLFAAGERVRATGNHFIDDRSSYTRRNLTFSIDILDAYRGLLRRSTCHSIWGVSLLPEHPSLSTTDARDPDLALAHGLVWLTNARKARTRRPGFPTWSWTSVDGHILSYSWTGALAPGGKHEGPAPNYPPELRSSTLKFRITDQDGIPMRLPELLPRYRDEFLLPETSHALDVEADIVRIHVRAATLQQQLMTATMVKRMLTFCRSSGNAATPCAGEDPAAREWPCFISIDCPDDPEGPDGVSGAGCVDAVILVSYVQEKNRSLAGAVMMLVKWKARDIAERVGLLRLEVPGASTAVDDALKTRRRIRLE